MRRSLGITEALARAYEEQQDKTARLNRERRFNIRVLHCRFTFSEWTASLNELAQGQRGRLPPTDARFRPDVRAIEEGRFTEVTHCPCNLTR